MRYFIYLFILLLYNNTYIKINTKATEISKGGFYSLGISKTQSNKQKVKKNTKRRKELTAQMSNKSIFKTSQHLKQLLNFSECRGVNNLLTFLRETYLTFNISKR